MQKTRGLEGGVAKEMTVPFGDLDVVVAIAARKGRIRLGEKAKHQVLVVNYGLIPFNIDIASECSSLLSFSGGTRSWVPPALKAAGRGRRPWEGLRATIVATRDGRVPVLPQTADIEVKVTKTPEPTGVPERTSASVDVLIR